QSDGHPRLEEVLEAEAERGKVTFGTTEIKAVSHGAISQLTVPLGLLHQRIGGLDYAARDSLGPLKQLADVRRTDVTADDCQIRRRIFRSRLLHHAAHPIAVIANGLPSNDAVFGDLFWRNLFNGHDGATELVIEAHHLSQHPIPRSV